MLPGTVTVIVIVMLIIRTLGEDDSWSLGLALQRSSSVGILKIGWGRLIVYHPLSMTCVCSWPIHHSFFLEWSHWPTPYTTPSPIWFQVPYCTNLGLCLWILIRVCAWEDLTLDYLLFLDNWGFYLLVDGSTMVFSFPELRLFSKSSTFFLWLCSTVAVSEGHKCSVVSFWYEDKENK